MNSLKFSARLRFTALLAVLSLALVGCIGQPTGTAWPALSTVNYNGETKLVLAYEGQIELLEPNTGQVVPLVDDQGNIRTDEEGNPRRWIIRGSEFDDATFFADPLTAQDSGEDTLLFPTLNSQLLEFYVDTARPANAGVAIGGSVLAEIVATESRYYVPYRTGILAAFDRESLEEIWRFETEEGIWSAPLLDDGIIYISSLDHHVYALDAETGETIWDTPPNLEGAVTSTPLIYDGNLYVGSFSHNLYKISLDGEILNEHEGENWIWSTPVVYDDVIYTTDLSGNVYAMNPDDLTDVWSAKPAEDGIRAAPLVTEQYVVVASRDGRVYWLDRESGAEAFEKEVEGRPEILSELLLLEQDEESGIPADLVIVGTQDTGRLAAAFQLDNSLQAWVYGR